MLRQCLMSGDVWSSRVNRLKPHPFNSRRDAGNFRAKTTKPIQRLFARRQLFFSVIMGERLPTSSQFQEKVTVRGGFPLSVGATASRSNGWVLGAAVAGVPPP
ncbi:hypothetical protein ACJJTC_007006 [Scirpophaga incertulas]